VSRVGRLIVVSNRLPLATEIVDNNIRFAESAGGLVTALVPILKQCGGCWVGWPGCDSHDGLEQALDEWSSGQPYSLAPVFLSQPEYHGFYRGFSNEIIWPLFHGFSSRCLFTPENWGFYCAVNEKFADAAEGASQKDDEVIWVHDYHLMLVGELLRRRGVRNTLAYFHHIPFPAPETFRILPWRNRILRALLEFDVVGFQTPSDQQNFIDCVRYFLPRVQVGRSGSTSVVTEGHRQTRVGAFPISIDFDEFASLGAEPAVAAEAESIRQCFGDTRIVLGIDRLDYSKGIIERLTAFRRLLELHSECRENVTFMQLVVPSREDIPEYRELKLRIENLVSNINGEFGTRNWMPVRYFHRHISRSDLVAFYRAADVALVTPLRDGMNLIAKEFCASRVDNQGVLILSEFAGAADELHMGALLVNPHDLEMMTVSLKQALAMKDHEQRIRMHLMRSHLRSKNVFTWAETFTSACIPSQLNRLSVIAS
jgi:alpha,alpha-trehalose-phosphate synthase [UDP-forming]